MDKFELEKRTKRFALKIIAFAATLPQSKAGGIVEYQLVKAGTSVGANYREANRAESRADFIHKIAIVEKESSESRYWLELSDDAGFGELKNERGYCKSLMSYSKSSQASVEVPRLIALAPKSWE
jgi:four helix bundle protein